MTKLSGRNEAILVLVEDTESLLKLLLRVSVLHLPCHEIKEFREINGTVSISINLVDHVLQVSLCGVLSKRPHNSSKLLGSDATCNNSKSFKVVG
ncbi:hypothetical protein HanIR_Chr12g0597021 [Helianthus annuus]|nr:hypothetical protein HanIR_Chr12g0597021 [Helianthus annuus]